MESTTSGSKDITTPVVREGTEDMAGVLLKGMAEGAEFALEHDG